MHWDFLRLNLPSVTQVEEPPLMVLSLEYRLSEHCKRDGPVILAGLNRRWAMTCSKLLARSNSEGKLPLCKAVNELATTLAEAIRPVSANRCKNYHLC